MVSRDGRVPPELSEAAMLYNMGIPGCWADIEAMPGRLRDDVLLIAAAVSNRAAKKGLHGRAH